MQTPRRSLVKSPVLENQPAFQVGCTQTAPAGKLKQRLPTTRIKTLKCRLSIKLTGAVTSLPDWIRFEFYHCSPHPSVHPRKLRERTHLIVVRDRVKQRTRVCSQHCHGLVHLLLSVQIREGFKFEWRTGKGMHTKGQTSPTPPKTHSIYVV